MVSASLTMKYAGALDRGRRALGDRHVEDHRHRRLGDDRRQRGVETAVLEDHRVDAADEVADLRERRLRFLVGVRDHRSRLFGVVVELLAGRAEPGRQRDQPLLGAVVEIAFDAAPLGLGTVDRRRPARLEAASLAGRVPGRGSGRAVPCAIDAWMLAAASVIHGATNRSPATPTAAAAIAPWTRCELEEVELRRRARAGDRRRTASRPSPAIPTRPSSSARTRSRPPGRSARW